MRCFSANWRNTNAHVDRSSTITDLALPSDVKNFTYSFFTLASFIFSSASLILSAFACAWRSVCKCERVTADVTAQQLNGHRKLLCSLCCSRQMAVR